MKNIYDTRYLDCDGTWIPIQKILKKSEAYRAATGPGWGTVDTDKDRTWFCDEDSHAILVDKFGKYTFISPYEELNPKTWPKQAECAAILLGNGNGDMFFEQEKGLVRICVTRNSDGIIVGFRLSDWTEGAPYEGEELIEFEDLPGEEAQGEAHVTR